MRGGIAQRSGAIPTKQSLARSKGIASSNRTPFGRSILLAMTGNKKIMIQTKEEILTSALPYIQRYEGTTFVIKYGGAAMTDELLKESFAKDVTLLKKIGINVVIVHGGGNEITELSAKLGMESRFVGGQRYTDEATLKTVVMTLAGSVNKEIVALINRAGGSAVGFAASITILSPRKNLLRKDTISALSDKSKK